MTDFLRTTQTPFLAFTQCSVHALPFELLEALRHPSSNSVALLKPSASAIAAKAAAQSWLTLMLCAGAPDRRRGGLPDLRHRLGLNP
jgi:hypothetical protein